MHNHCLLLNPCPCDSVDFDLRLIMFRPSLETTPLPQHRMYCTTGTRKGLVDMPYRFRISPQESWGTYFVCTSYGVRLNFVIASRLIKRYPAMPANVARSLFIHPRYTKTVWHVDQTLPRAGDAIHPVLWKRCGFQTSLGQETAPLSLDWKCRIFCR